MRIFRGFEEVKGIRNPVVTTGSFDGVHIGHKMILNRLAALAKKHGGESVLITFDPHPRKVLYPDSAGKELKLINSREEKLRLMSKAGLDNLIIVNFTREFSRITSEQFVKDLLHDVLHAKVIVVGFNHHFGFNKEGDYRQLWGWRHKYDFEAEEIPEQEVQHETVSSTKIRKAISEGYIQRANAYLDHYYLVMGIPAKEPHTELPEFFRVPVTEECKLLPAPGLYAVSAAAGENSSKGMALITGEGDTRPQLLLQIFENSDAYSGITADILFHKKIHGSVNLTDDKTSLKLDAARTEIDDLIY